MLIGGGRRIARSVRQRGECGANTRDSLSVRRVLIVGGRRIARSARQRGKCDANTRDSLIARRSSLVKSSSDAQRAVLSLDG